MNHFRRQGFLRSGACVLWSWTNDGEEVASLEMLVGFGVLHLEGVDHRYDARKIDHAVSTTYTSCNYGGSRPWFRCPNCGRRAGKLYLPLGRRHSLCRRCYDLAYHSQWEEPWLSAPSRSALAPWSSRVTGRARAHVGARGPLVPADCGAAGGASRAAWRAPAPPAPHGTSAGRHRPGAAAGLDGAIEPAGGRRDTDVELAHDEVGRKRGELRHETGAGRARRSRSRPLRRARPRGGSFIGFIAGVLPGAGASLGSFVAYTVERRISN